MQSTTHELRVRQHATPVLVQAIEPQPGLRVYMQPEELQGPGEQQLWRLGHHSGHPLAAFETRAEAERAAAVIADYTDWTRSAEDLRTDRDFDLTGYYDQLMEHTTALIIAR
ncbi:hypothetical protein [Streptomyces poriferorum]|uniref:Uncharacterized protein n=1 Tax=Streptomyces poriferorum TaxID=2798799 RepID=A0ABY9J025_9ACTN|nr:MULTISPECIES: hypothetical protein [unclassified Streptomyces]MDP5310467.1 hypothetical protein [Streptomyces sp. Alt4]WLQ60379.1 hypothetical protein P8A19_35370 [Streptomyces sp. Alt2]